MSAQQDEKESSSTLQLEFGYFLDLSFIGLQLYREEKIITPKSLNNSEMCIHTYALLHFI